MPSPDLFVFNESSSFKMHHSCAPMTDTLLILIFYIVSPFSHCEDTQRSNLPHIIAQEVAAELGFKPWTTVRPHNQPSNHCVLWLPGFVFDTP